MKYVRLPLVLGMLALFSGAAAADSAPANQTESRVIPVLLRVDSHGKITRVTPAMRLAPSIERLMRANLDEMINRPATDKNGKPVASQVVINLSLDTSQDANGTYNAKFSYISTTPVAPGSWYWVRTDNMHYGLAQQKSVNSRENMRLDSHRGTLPTPAPAPAPSPGGNTH